MVRKPIQHRLALSSAFRERNFHAASRRRQVRIGSGVRVANLDITTTDVVIFVRAMCLRSGRRFSFFGRTFSLWFA
jgi:hypothetical protein